ncbi:MAG: chemotaxis response regulator protein-glutamate methylesterase [Alphaproteobacteria bacterium]|nr:MAG: chemotaxis response regulator protein-glutamate methylesterase [Alphaproteobacteria bacterium]
MSIENKITVVLVDDSSVIRGALARIIETDPNIEIVASVSNGEMAVSMAANKKPDVMILDIEMPVMDGLTALPKILEKSPKTKVVMFSALTAKGADTTIKAMALGAVECIVKPASSQDTGPGSEFHRYITGLINTLGGAHLLHTQPTRDDSKASPKQRDLPSPRTRSSGTFVHPEILAIGSSTGGPQALFKVLKNVGTVNIPIVITQHMPATFTKILAEHISQHANMPAQEGEDGMLVENGHIYVAPGGKHMGFKKENGALVVKLNDDAPENFCKPAVDVMMRSLVEIYQNKILCVILTGMGQDGLIGARQLHQLGGRILAQDKETSVVWGMPGAVATAEICDQILPIDDIGPAIKKIIG